jgi:hypothetical protein
VRRVKTEEVCMPTSKAVQWIEEAACILVIREVSAIKRRGRESAVADGDSR